MGSQKKKKGQKIDESKVKEHSNRRSSGRKSLAQGGYNEPKEFDFEYFAGDHLTVRALEDTFYLCCVLEDVAHEAETMRVQWYDTIAENIFKLSYDDIIYSATIITQVDVIEDPTDSSVQIKQKDLSRTDRLLHKSLVEDGTIKKGAKRKSDAQLDKDDDGPKLSKRKKTSKQVKKVKVNRGLIPQPEILLLENESVFYEKNSKIPLMGVKKGIAAAIQRDLKKMKILLKDTKNIYTVHWMRSCHLEMGPVAYAIKQEDKEMLKLMHETKRQNIKAQPPKCSLEKKDTGSWSFHNLGHAVRDVALSRGNAEGDNAFVYDDCELVEDLSDADYLKYAVEINCSYEFIKWLFKDYMKYQNEDFYNYISVAVENGHLELASKMITDAVKIEELGFNFLHKETLCNKKQPLTKFKVTSVTKKPSVQNKVYPLHCSCINPNPAYCKQLFISVPEYNFPDYKDSKPIHYAAACSGDGPLKFLLSRGVDPNTLDKENCTPLIIAAKTNRPHNIRALMDCKISGTDEEGNATEETQVNITAKCNKTMTALHHAAEDGNLEAVETLIELGAQVDCEAAHTLENATPLVLATKQAEYKVFKALLKAGAKPDKTVARSKTALMYACMNGHAQITAHLLNVGVDPNSSDTSDNTALHYAAAYGWYHCVQLLLQAGSDVNKHNTWRTSALAVAVYKSHLDIVELLLAAPGCNVDSPDDQGQTILLQQISQPYTREMVKMITYLVEEKKADVNVKDVKGFNALHHLAAHAVFQQQNRGYPRLNKESLDLQLEIADMLISNGCEVNAVSEDGNSVLTIAVAQNNYGLAMLLLERGADANNGMPDGYYCIHKLINNTDNIDVREYFPNEYEEHKDIDCWNDEYHTVIPEITQRYECAMMESLLKHNCDVEVLSRVKNETPLIMSLVCGHGRLHLFSMLVRHGASPFLGKRTDNAHNFLHVLCAERPDPVIFQGLKDIFKKHGNELWTPDFLESVDKKGMTPILIAAQTLLERCDAENVNWLTEQFLFLVDELGCQVNKSVVQTEDNCDVGDTILHYLSRAKVPHLIKLFKHIVEILPESSLNQMNEKGYAPIHECLVAIKQCQGEMISEYEERIRTLVTTGADVNLAPVYPNDKRTLPLTLPFIMAVRKPCIVSTVKLLLENGADPDKKEQYTQHTAIMTAVEESTLYKACAATKLLLEHGASINMCDAYQRTALHYAVNQRDGAYGANMQVEYLLLKHGAHRFVADKDGNLPIYYAFKNIDSIYENTTMDPVSLVDLLCKVDEGDLKEQGQGDFAKRCRDYLNHTNKHGRTVLHMAALRGASISCLCLHKLSVEYNVQDIDGNTPLSLALRAGHHGCGMELMKQGADPNCDIVTPVSQAQLDQYEARVKQAKWQVNRKVDKPEKTQISALQLAVKKGWEGLVYYMLENCGVPIIKVFKAMVVEKKWQLARSMLMKWKTSIVEVKNEKQQNMLHLITVFGEVVSSDLTCMLDEDPVLELAEDEKFEIIPKRATIQIAHMLLDAGVDATARDDQGNNPLHYAARACNLPLCKLLLANRPHLLNVTADDENPCPLIRAVGNPHVHTLDSKRVAVLKYFATKDVNFNIAMSGVLGGQNESYSLLQAMIIYDNSGNFDDEPRRSKSDVKHKGGLEFLLKQKGINVNATVNGKSALHFAVERNNEKCVNILLKHKPKMDLQDAQGNTCLHLCVHQNKYEFYENKDMLKKLIKAGASTTISNNKGETPLEVAVRINSKPMIEVLKKKNQKLSFLKPLDDIGFTFSSAVDEYWSDIVQVDVEEHSRMEIETSVMDVDVDTSVVQVDDALNMETNGEVYVDPVTKIAYDAIMSKVDVKHGTYGMNSFYKLQVVYHKGKNLWLLFNRWGRIGVNKGQHQQTPFLQPEDATKEFKKIFKSKTGNDWLNKDDFVRKPKKYAIIENEKNPERMVKHQEELIKPFDLDKSPASKLSKSLQKFLQKITNYRSIQQSFDSNLMAFGQTSVETIENARKILAEIRSITEEEVMNNYFDNQQEWQNEPKVKESFEKIYELSNSFHMLLTPSNFEFERVKPINQPSAVSQYEMEITKFIDLNSTAKMLLAAQYNLKAVCPLDYCYRSLNCRIECLDPYSDESNLILRGIFNQDPTGVTVGKIFRVERKASRYDGHVGNKHLLWHGTRMESMTSILRDGLQKDALHCNRTGSNHGSGVYFSWNFTKANCYSRGVLLLCEVALGKVCKKQNRIDMDETKYDSLWIPTHEEPDPKFHVTTPYDARFLLGKLVTVDKEISSHLQNEIIVWNDEQIKIRYIVTLK